LSAGTVFRVLRHPEPVAPDPADGGMLSFRHLDADPACTGAQLAETDAERAA
jgi:hypothetical protein